MYFNERLGHYRYQRHLILPQFNLLFSLYRNTMPTFECLLDFFSFLSLRFFNRPFESYISRHEMFVPIVHFGFLVLVDPWPVVPAVAQGRFLPLAETSLRGYTASAGYLRPRPSESFPKYFNIAYVSSVLVPKPQHLRMSFSEESKLSKRESRKSGPNLLSFV